MPDALEAPADAPAAPQAAPAAGNGVLPNWEQVASRFTAAYPNVPPEEIQRTYEGVRNVSEWRARLANSEETMGSWLYRRALPVASAQLNIRNAGYVDKARQKILSGQGTPEDAEVIAVQNRLAESDANASGGTRVAGALASIPAVLGEAYLTGGVGRAVGIGAATTGVGRFAQGAVSAPLMPSLYAERAIQNNREAGRPGTDWRGFPSAMTLAALQNGVFSAAGNLGGAAPTGPGTIDTARRVFAQGVGAMAVQQGIDIGTSAVDDVSKEVFGQSLNLSTRYGLLGRLWRGEQNEAMQEGLTQAITMFAFAGLHEAVNRPPGSQTGLTLLDPNGPNGSGPTNFRWVNTPEGPSGGARRLAGPIEEGMRQTRGFLNDLSAQGRSPAEAGSELSRVMTTVHGIVSEQGITKEAARQRVIATFPEGQTREYGLRVVDLVPLGDASVQRPETAPQTAPTVPEAQTTPSASPSAPEPSQALQTAPQGEAVSLPVAEVPQNLADPSVTPGSQESISAPPVPKLSPMERMTARGRAGAAQTAARPAPLAEMKTHQEMRAAPLRHATTTAEVQRIIQEAPGFQSPAEMFARHGIPPVQQAVLQARFSEAHPTFLQIAQDLQPRFSSPRTGKAYTRAAIKAMEKATLSKLGLKESVHQAVAMGNQNALAEKAVDQHDMVVDSVVRGEVSLEKADTKLQDLADKVQAAIDDLTDKTVAEVNKAKAAGATDADVQAIMDRFQKEMANANSKSRRPLGQNRQAPGSAQSNRTLSPQVQANAPTQTVAPDIALHASTSTPERSSGPAKPISTGDVKAVSSISPHHDALVNKLGSMVRGANLPLEQKMAYLRTQLDILGRMTPEFAELHNKGLKQAVFFGNVKELTQSIAHSPKVREALAQGNVAGGSYNYSNGVMRLDGGTAQSSAARIAAHEATHSAEGKEMAVANSPGWKNAWEKEIKSGAIGGYAATDIHEGLAEVMGLVNSGELSTEALHERFPLVAAELEGHGWIPDRGGEAGFKKADDVFDKAIHDGPLHADTLLSVDQGVIGQAKDDLLSSKWHDRLGMFDQDAWPKYEAKLSALNFNELRNQARANGVNVTGMLGRQEVVRAIHERLSEQWRTNEASRRGVEEVTDGPGIGDADALLHVSQQQPNEDPRAITSFIQQWHGDESGHVDPEVLRDFAIQYGVKPATAAISHLNTVWRQLAGEGSPRTTDAAPRVGEALERFNNADIYARFVAPVLADKVLAGHDSPEFRERLGGVLTERSLRWTKKHYNKAAHAASADLQAAISDRQAAEAGERDAKQQADEYRKNGMPKAAETADAYARTFAKARKEAQERATEASARSAENIKLKNGVGTIIGQPDSPFATVEQYLAARRSPEIDNAIMLHNRFVVPVMDDAFRRSKGMNPTDPINSPTQIPGSPVNLKSAKSGDKDVESVIWTKGEGVAGEAGTPGPQRDGRPPNAKLRQNRHTRQRTGSSEGYDIDYAKMVEHSLVHQLVNAAKAEAVRTGVEAGLYKWGKPGSSVSFEGDAARWGQEFNDVKPPKGTQQDLAGETSLYVHPDLAHEFRRAIEIDEPTKFKTIEKAMSAIMAVNLASTAELTYHAKNQLGFLMRAGLNPISLFKNTVGVIQKDPAIMAQLVELARIGTMKAEGFEVESWWQEGKFNPLRALKWGAKLLDLTRKILLLQGNAAYDRMVKAGLTKPSETGRRNFLNQLGNYNHRSQHKLVKLLRDTQIGPFATAGFNYLVQGVRSVVMNPGVKPVSMEARIRLRAGMLLRTVAILAAVEIINKALWGKLDGSDDTPLGAVRVGQNDAGRAQYIDIMDLIGLKRGLRVLGLLALAEGKRKNALPEKIEERAARDMVTALVHPMAGPGAQFGLTSAFGVDASGFHVAQHASTLKHESQPRLNIQAAIEHANPALGTLFGHSQAQKPMGQRIMELAGPFGVKTAPPPRR